MLVTADGAGGIAAAVAEAFPGLTVAGGLASGGIAPGQNILYAGGDPVNSGAVAVVLRGATRLVTAVSQGCRPIGPPLVATRVKGNAIFELKGQPAANSSKPAILDNGVKVMVPPFVGPDEDIVVNTETMDYAERA